MTYEDLKDTSTQELLTWLLQRFRDDETNYHIAETVEFEKEKETQDILHRLELHDDPYLVKKRLTDELPRIRRERRVAKEFVERTDPIMLFLEKDKKTISCLQQLLGELRNVEKKLSKPKYWNRTNIVKNTIGNMVDDI